MPQNYYASLNDSIFTQVNNSSTHNHFVKYNDLKQRFLSMKRWQNFVVCELSFGYGANFLDTCEVWQNQKQTDTTLHYISFLASPLQPSQLAQLLHKNSRYNQELSEQLIKQYKLLLPGYHRLNFDNNIMLTLIIGNDNDKFAELNHKIDAWYLSPPHTTITHNLELNSNNCDQLARLSNQNTTCVIKIEQNSEFITNLSTVGFNLCSCNYHNHDQIFYGSYLPKITTTTKPRHQPTYYTRDSSHITQSKQIAVIGAGISGAATAFSLAKRGYQVTIYEKNSEPAMEASGNYQGMLYASWSAFGGAMMDLNFSAYRYAHNLITDQLTPELDYSTCGLIQLGHTTEQIHRNQQLLTAYLPDDFLTSVNAKQISTLARLEVNSGMNGIYYPSGLWLNPPSLIKALLQHPNIKLITNCNIDNLEQINDQWLLFDSNNKLINKIDCLVLCNAHYINHFKQTANLTIRKIRGQISIATHNSNLKTILCGSGYITPNKASKFTFGATFQFNDSSTEVRIEDHQLNLNDLSHSLPQIAAQLNITELTGQTNFRASPHDYLPLVGPLAKYTEFKQDYAKLSQDKNARISPICQYHTGLYLNLGHGAKGLLSAPLSGEIIADYIAGTPLACSESLRKALHPNRLYVHELVHSHRKHKKSL